MKLSELGELGLIAELERRGLARGIENDAAELEGGLVVTQDALVEDAHFRLGWISWRDLGWRAAAVNLSDLAASGAAPAALVVSLAVPPLTAVEDVLELYEGIAETQVPVVGGDTSRAECVMLSLTALGRSKRVPGRGGARCCRAPGGGGCSSLSWASSDSSRSSSDAGSHRASTTMRRNCGMGSS